MNSITKHMDGDDIAMEVRFLRKAHKGAFLLLEGETDIHRFDKFVASPCETINCYGRRKAIDAISILYEDGFSGAIAVVDADFDRLIGPLFEHEGLIYSQTHDLDIDWALHGVLAEYLEGVGDKAKISAIGSCGAVIEKIFHSLLPLTLVRLAKEQLGLRVKLSEIFIDEFYEPYIFDLAAYLDRVFHGVRPAIFAERKVIEDYVRERSMHAIDLQQATNGHDFHVALGKCLRQSLGNRRDPQTWGPEISLHIRMTCDDRHLKQMRVFEELKNWQIAENYIVLQQRLLQ